MTTPVADFEQHRNVNCLHDLPIVQASTAKRQDVTYGNLLGSLGQAAQERHYRGHPWPSAARRAAVYHVADQAQ